MNSLEGIFDCMIDGRKAVGVKCRGGISDDMGEGEKDLLRPNGGSQYWRYQGEEGNSGVKFHGY